MRAALEPGTLDLVGPEIGRDAAVGAHRALARRVDECDDDPVALPRDRADELDTELAQSCGGERPGVVSAALADEAGASAELGDPGGDVGGLPAGAEHDARPRVGPRREWLLEPDDHVQHEVPEAADRHRIRSSHGKAMLASRRCRPQVGHLMQGRGLKGKGMRSLLIGGLLGASAAAVARRLRPRRPRVEAPSGLGAFESAPCYRELSERNHADGP